MERNLTSSIQNLSVVLMLLFNRKQRHISDLFFYVMFCLQAEYVHVGAYMSKEYSQKSCRLTREQNCARCVSDCTNTMAIYSW